MAFSSTQLVSRLLTTGIALTVSCNEACQVGVRATVGGVGSGTDSAIVAETAGQARLGIRLGSRIRSLLRAHPTSTIKLKIAAVDGAGNLVQVERTARAQTLAQRRGH